MKQPVKINLIEQKYLEIIWNDESKSKYPLKYLRDESPDAANKGETILWKHFPPKKQPDKPGKYEIKSIEAVGNYGISITWKDNYNYGIFTWDFLLSIENNL